MIKFIKMIKIQSLISLNKVWVGLLFDKSSLFYYPELVNLYNSHSAGKFSSCSKLSNFTLFRQDNI